MIKQELWQGTPVYVLENSMLSVTLCPSLNNNVIRIRDLVLQRDVLKVPESPGQLKRNPALYGTPILFPPNRIRRGTFTFENRTYQFDTNEIHGNNLHGIINHYPWEVVQIIEEEDACSITSVFRIENHQETFRQFPHEFELEVTYELRGRTLNHHVKATNYSKQSAPFGYGLHPWFQLDHEPEKWTLTMPVEGVWQLGEENLPTGEIELLHKGTYSSLLEGMNLRGHSMDTVFQIGHNSPSAVLKGPHCELRYTATPGMVKQWVVYTNGQTDEDICLEPYTWVTDAPNLPMERETTGFRFVAPGESLDLDIRLEVLHS